jgi:hypothetical protein
MSTMAPPTDRGQPASVSNGSKSFFDILPRELRDDIYDHTFDHEATLPEIYHMRFQAPLPHLRLVSRQFKHEYDERSPKDTTLFVTDQRLPSKKLPFVDKASMLLPRLATRCTVLHFTHNLQDQTVMEAGDILGRRVAWFCGPLGHWLAFRLPHLQDVHIKCSFNFVQNLAKSRLHFRPREVLRRLAREYMRHLSKLGIVTRIEWSHLGISSHGIPSQLMLDLPSLESLTESVALGRYERPSRCFDTKWELHEDLIEQRSAAEAVFLAAWETKHGCSFRESVSKQYNT